MLLQKLVDKAKSSRKSKPPSPFKKGTIVLGSDCCGLGSDFVSLKLAFGNKLKLETAFISDPRHLIWLNDD